MRARPVMMSSTTPSANQAASAALSNGSTAIDGFSGAERAGSALRSSTRVTDGPT
jgi:hypothetical protein